MSTDHPTAGAPGNRPSGRDPLLDLLRTVALGRVVVWHLFAATWLTWFAAVPVLFVVAGALLEAPTRTGGFVARRLRRMLVPLWAYGACLVLVRWWSTGTVVRSPRAVLDALTWVLPVVGPTRTGWDDGWLSSHLWYLRAYLWIVVLAPVLVALSRRLLTVAVATAAAVVGLELAAAARLAVIGHGPLRVVLGDVVVYGFFAVVGVAARRRVGVEPHRAWFAAGAAVFGAGAVAYAVVVGLGPEGVNASYPAALLVGLAWVGLLGTVEPALRRIAGRPGSTDASAECRSGRSPSTCGTRRASCSRDGSSPTRRRPTCSRSSR